MNTANTTNPASPARGVMTYVTGGIAILTCPCHLPILIVLLSGTAAGAFLSENLGIALLLLVPIFLLSAITTWRLLDKGDDDKLTENSPGGPQRLSGVAPRTSSSPIDGQRLQ